MKINRSLDEISDGILYGINDMVKANTNGCEGCSDCCYEVGDYVQLTPFDVYLIVLNTGVGFDELMENKMVLRQEEKINLPYLKMVGEDQACSFLGENGRCTIHEYRPGICRLFPLGRYYEEDDLKYIIQPGDCPKPNLTKIKVKKWISIDRYNDNKEFLLAWRDFIKTLKWRVRFIHNDHELDDINKTLLTLFYSESWSAETDFYKEFYQKLAAGKERFDLL